jgi:hypothetical protein
VSLNTDHQKDFCQWFTSPAVAQAFLAWAGVEDHHTVLEPSAGEGALVPNRPGVLAFEIDPDLIAELKYWRPEATVICANFLEVEPLLQMDLAITNPPYSGVARDGEGTFILQCLKWAPRCCALIRTVAFQGKGRFEKCWRYVKPTRIGLLTERPRYLGPGGRPTDLNPYADFMAVECVLRDVPLPADGYSGFVIEVELSWLDWKAAA